MMQLPINDRMEDLSLAYVRAVAAQAGFMLDVPSRDRNSRDGTIKAYGGRRPSLDFQLKSHKLELTKPAPATFPFDLPINNYNDLRETDVTTPQILFVVLLPQDEKAWCELTIDGLIVRKAGYWLSLAGQPETENSTKQRVYVPTANKLDPQALGDIMRSIDKRAWP